MRILVTGGTGFLGTEVLNHLCAAHEVTLISRQDGGNSGVKQIKADITLWNMGLEPEKFVGQFDCMLHMAGLYDLRASGDDLQLMNVIGTHNALSFAKKVKIPIFAFTSTIAAAINQTSRTVSPRVLNIDKPFPDEYARTKAMAENLVRTEAEHFKSVMNFRLGPLVGSTTTGKILRADGPYQVTQSLAKLRKLILMLPNRVPLPGSTDRRMPILPVDIAAKAIGRLMTLASDSPEEWSGYHSFHLVPEKGLLVKEYYRDAFQFLGLISKKPLLTENLPKKFVTKVTALVGSIPEQELFYILNMPNFETHETTKALGEDWCPEYRDYKQMFWKGYETYISNRRN